MSPIHLRLIHLKSKGWTPTSKISRLKSQLSAILNNQCEIKASTQPTASIQKSYEPDENQIWSLYFDGSKSKEGAGVGYVIIDPAGNKTLLARRLEFECTNNIAEYEALLQGLRKALDMHI
jgi:hypothetical protein